MGTAALAFSTIAEAVRAPALPGRYSRASERY